MSTRIRIRINQRDGTCPTPDEACGHEVHGSVPFPRGRDTLVSVVNEDGTETRLRNVKRFTLRCNGRQQPVTAIIELYNPVIDLIVPAEMVESNDPEGGDFLGEDRTHAAG